MYRKGRIWCGECRGCGGDHIFRRHCLSHSLVVDLMASNETPTENKLPWLYLLHLICMCGRCDKGRHILGFWIRQKPEWNIKKKNVLLHRPLLWFKKRRRAHTQTFCYTNLGLCDQHCGFEKTRGTLTKGYNFNQNPNLGFHKKPNIRQFIQQT